MYRRAKQDIKLDDLRKTSQAEVKALAFELNHNHQRSPAGYLDRSSVAPPVNRIDTLSATPPESAPATVATLQQPAAQLGRQLGNVLRYLDQPSGMPGLKVKLRCKNREREPE